MAHRRDAWATTRADAASAPRLTALPGTRDRRARSPRPVRDAKIAVVTFAAPNGSPHIGSTFDFRSMSSPTPTGRSIDCSVPNEAASRQVWSVGTIRMYARLDPRRSPAPSTDRGHPPTRRRRRRRPRRHAPVPVVAINT